MTGRRDTVALKRLRAHRDSTSACRPPPLATAIPPVLASAGPVDVASRGPLAALVVAVIAAGHLGRVFAVDRRRGLVAAERPVSWPEHGSWRVVDHPVGCVVLSGVLCVYHRSNLQGGQDEARRRGSAHAPLPWGGAKREDHGGARLARPARSVSR